MGRAGNKAAAKKTPAPRSGNTQVVVVTGRLIDSNTVEIKGSKGRAAREITVHFSRRGVIVHGFQHVPDIDNLGFMVVADIPDSVSRAAEAVYRKDRQGVEFMFENGVLQDDG